MIEKKNRQERRTWKLKGGEVRKITEEDLKQMGGTLDAGKKHPLRAQIELLQAGEILYIPKEKFRWKGGHTPNKFCKEIAAATGRKFDFSIAGDMSGWVVKRVK